MANTLGQTVESLREQLQSQIERLTNDNAALYNDLHDYLRTIKELREELQGATQRIQYHLRNIKELRKQVRTLKHENAKLKAMIKGEHTYWNEAEAEAAALESGKLAAKGFRSELQKLADKFNS
tara:strand:- start:1324 stop:1695 length:372 start_codon:yes stop_codon:yes gene_type:complete